MATGSSPSEHGNRDGQRLGQGQSRPLEHARWFDFAGMQEMEREGDKPALDRCELGRERKQFEGLWETIHLEQSMSLSGLTGRHFLPTVLEARSLHCQRPHGRRTILPVCPRGFVQLYPPMSASLSPLSRGVHMSPSLLVKH